MAGSNLVIFIWREILGSREAVLREAAGRKPEAHEEGLRKWRETAGRKVAGSSRNGGNIPKRQPINIA